MKGLVFITVVTRPLTSQRDTNKPQKLTLNIATIESFQTRIEEEDPKAKTCVTLINNSGAYNLEETPEEVARMIECACDLAGIGCSL